MKVALLIIFILSSTVISAQSVEPRLTKKETIGYRESMGEFRLGKVEWYNYDAFGNLSTLDYRYVDTLGNIKRLNQYKYEYNSNNQLIKETDRRYNETVDLWINNSWDEYQYDNNGCLVEHNHVENVGSGDFRKGYIRDDLCRVIKEMSLAENNDFHEYKETEYLNEGKSNILFEYRYSNHLNDFFLYKEHESIYNEKGLLEYDLKSYYNDEDTTYVKSAYRYEYVYDYNGVVLNRKSYSYYSHRGEWEFNSSEDYENVYNQDDFLISQTRTYSSVYLDSLVHSFTTEREYTRDCKGLIELENYKDTLNVRDIKYVFYYEGKDDCHELNKEDEQVIIFPNPSSGFIEVQSPLFLTGDTQVLIVDMKGQLVFEKMIYSRVEQTSLNLPTLPNGVYSIRLLNKDFKAMEKLVIMK